MEALPALLLSCAAVLVVAGSYLGLAMQDWRAPSALLGIAAAVAAVALVLARKRPA